MNNMMRVYLAGPIFGRTDREAIDWRQRVQTARPGHVYLDPMVRDYRGREDESVREIVEGDKADIDSCDLVIANVTIPSAGTLMEVLYAWERGKPVVAIVSGRVSPWIRYHTVEQVTSLDAAIEGLPA